MEGWVLGTFGRFHYLAPFLVLFLCGVGLPLPEFAARQLESLVNARALVPVPAGVEVTRVEAADGALTVFGRRR